TAELATRALNPHDGLVTTAELAPGNPVPEVLAMLSELRDDSLIVGHDPVFSELVSVLLTAASPAAIDFSKGGVVALQFAGRPSLTGGKLLWYLRRKQLARLAH